MTMTLSNAIEEFLFEQAARGNSKNTVRDYRTKLSFFLKYYGDLDVRSITVKDCRDYYLHLREKIENTISIQTYIRSLRAFLKWLFTSEYIDVDLCLKFKLPKARQMVIHPLSDEEIKALFATFPGDDLLNVRNRLILALMLDCGLRVEEVVNAKVTDLFLPDRCLIITGKGNKQRAIAFGLNTEALLRQYLPLRKSRTNLLIIKVSGEDAGEGIKISTIKNLFRKLKKRSGVSRIYPHLLRHTFGTRYIENGGNMFALQLLLGHTSLNMVKRYVHLANSRLREEFVNFSPLDRLSKKE